MRKFLNSLRSLVIPASNNLRLALADTANNVNVNSYKTGKINAGVIVGRNFQYCTPVYLENKKTGAIALCHLECLSTESLKKAKLTLDNALKDVSSSKNADDCKDIVIAIGAHIGSEGDIGYYRLQNFKIVMELFSGKTFHQEISVENITGTVAVNVKTCREFFYTPTICDEFFYIKEKFGLTEEAPQKISENFKQSSSKKDDYPLTTGSVTSISQISALRALNNEIQNGTAK